MSSKSAYATEYEQKIDRIGSLSRSIERTRTQRDRLLDNLQHQRLTRGGPVVIAQYSDTAPIADLTGLGLFDDVVEMTKDLLDQAEERLTLERSQLIMRLAQEHQTDGS